MPTTEFAGIERTIFEAATDLARKSGHSVEHVLTLLEERRTRDLFDDDGRLMRREGIPGELALRLLELDRLKSR